ncbi:MAG: hypothetical protein KAR54_02730 [Candidatus Pacebacteria bacterium]|nr:hypothetical protein [Candidatus Paceibacterota bacterium]
MNKIIYSWPVNFILLCIVLFLIKNVFDIYQGEKLSSINREHSESVFAGLENKSNLIEEEIKLLKTEKGIEAEIRDKFRVVREGEQMAVIINSDKSLDKEKLKKKKDGLWEHFLDFFSF